MKSNFIQMVFNTIQREIRSKTLVFMLVLSLGMIFLTHTFVDFIYKELLNDSATMLIGDKALIITIMGINLWAVGLTMMFGARTLREDMKEGYLAQFLTFPISRIQYFSSRFVGNFVLTILFYLLSLFFAVLLLDTGSKGAIDSWSFWAGVGVMFYYLSGVLTLSIFVSMFISKSFVLVGTGLLMGIISMSNSYVSRAGAFELSFGTVLANVFHYLFPPFGKMSGLASELFTYSKDSDLNYAVMIHYSLALIGLLSLIMFLFKRKDL